MQNTGIKHPMHLLYTAQRMIHPHTCMDALGRMGPHLVPMGGCEANQAHHLTSFWGTAEKAVERGSDRVSFLWRFTTCAKTITRGEWVDDYILAYL